MRPTNIKLHCTIFDGAIGYDKAGWKLVTQGEDGVYSASCINARQAVMMSATILACSRDAMPDATEEWVRVVMDTLEVDSMIGGEIGVKFMHEMEEDDNGE